MFVLIKLFRFLLHPLAMPAYALGIYWLYGEYRMGQDPVILAISTFIIMVLMPAVALWLMKALKLGNDYIGQYPINHFGKIIIVAVFYLWMFFTIRKNPDLENSLMVIYLGACISLFLGFFLSFLGLHSFHMLGIGYCCGAAIAFFAQGLGYSYLVIEETIWRLDESFWIIIGLVFSAILALCEIQGKERSKMVFLRDWFVGALGPIVAGMIYQG